MISYRNIRKHMFLHNKTVETYGKHMLLRKQLRKVAESICFRVQTLRKLLEHLCFCTKRYEHFTMRHCAVLHGAPAAPSEGAEGCTCFSKRLFSF